MASQNTSQLKTRGDRRKTFHDIHQTARQEAAESAWARARLASALRQAAMDQGRYHAAMCFGQIKMMAIDAAISILPERVTVGIDDHFHVGLLSVRYRGLGRMHLPAEARIPAALAG